MLLVLASHCFLNKKILFMSESILKNTLLFVILLNLSFFAATHTLIGVIAKFMASFKKTDNGT